MKLREGSSADRAGLDVEALERDLKRKLRGEVRFDRGSRALYSTDASNYRQVPIGVVVPKDVEDVVDAVAVCRAHGAPILSRGGGTSLAGQCCNVAVVLDFSRHVDRLLEIDPQRRRARVEPGIVLDDLRSRAAMHGLTFGPDPASHDRCTLGGMIGNDSCGVHSVMAAFEGEGARTADSIAELEVLTYDGLRMRVGPTDEQERARIRGEGGRRAEIYAALEALVARCGSKIREEFPDIPRRVSGYNLPYLLPENGFNVARALVGSEGTCVTVLEATALLLPNPRERVLLVLGFADVFEAADRVPLVLEHRPIGLEGIDRDLVEDMRRVRLHPDNLPLLPAGEGWLLVEFGGETHEEAAAKAHRLAERLSRDARPPTARLFERPEEQRRIWEVRESSLAATAHVPGAPLTWEGWEDAAVAPEKLGGYLRDLRRLLQKFGYRGDFYGHFGQGCVHTRTDFDLQTQEGIGRFRAFLDEAADLVVSYGGSLSGEHGDGQSRAELLPKMFSPELIAAFREFKRIWDPEGRMNPGKVVDPYPIVANLRLGADHRPARPQTQFRYVEDGGDFSRALLRCVGVGKCRQSSAGTMCPSFMVTREEAHSTRGRARLLYEMLRGDALPGGFRERSVREALDLCLACKACKRECPVAVDMATYKAEFLARHYRGRLRPRSAYAFGLSPWWARIASAAPRLANLFTQTPALARLARSAAGIAPERQIPAFASETFRSWFSRRGIRNPERPAVLLFPDTFNNFFHPGTARAAVEVLEEAGFRVTVPRGALCCGRPLYDYGMLGLARRTLTRILGSLRAEIRAGLPMIVLEPSCAAVFRDELLGLFPENEDAQRLSEQTFLLSEFLNRKAEGFVPRRLAGKAIVQAHCHQRAIMTMSDEEALLRRTGLDFEILDSGCCGMAGAFGFERGERYEVSLRCAERVLFPALREAAPGTLVLADGFSCREQIRQGTGRRALHLAEVLAFGL